MCQIEQEKTPREMILHLLLVLFPFMVLHRAVLLWLNNTYLYDWMEHRHYLALWFTLGIVSFVQPKFAIVASYGYVACVVIGERLGTLILENNKLTATPEDYIMSCHGKLSHQGLWIWFQLYFTVIVLYVAYVRQIEPRIKARRERRGK